MIDRYSTPAMRSLWSREAQFARLIVAAEASARATDLQFNLGGVLARAALDVADRTNDLFANPADIDQVLSRWAELERRYDHDIVAFVELYRELLRGDGGAAPTRIADWFHVGRTSSDLVDTALGMALRAAGDLIEDARRQLAFELAGKALEHLHDYVRGRTHGQPAEYTTIGRRFAVILSEVEATPLTEYAIGKLSGPVGVHHAGTVEILKSYGLEAVPSTQIVPRVYLATMMGEVLAATVPISDLASLIRLGARGGASSWVSEGRRGPEARGSSAMPGKRNPIRSERAHGLAIYIRSTATALVESSAGLWEERDISHSSVERVGLPAVLGTLEWLYRDMAETVSRLDVGGRQVSTIPTLTPARVVTLSVSKGADYSTAYRDVETRGVDYVAASYGLTDLDAVPYDPSDEKELWDMVDSACDNYETAGTR